MKTLKLQEYVKRGTPINLELSSAGLSQCHFFFLLVKEIFTYAYLDGAKLTLKTSKSYAAVYDPIVKSKMP